MEKVVPHHGNEKEKTEEIVLRSKWKQWINYVLAAEGLEQVFDALKLDISWRRAEPRAQDEETWFVFPPPLCFFSSLASFPHYLWLFLDKAYI